MQLELIRRSRLGGSRPPASGGSKNRICGVKSSEMSSIDEAIHVRNGMSYNCGVHGPLAHLLTGRMARLRHIKGRPRLYEEHPLINPPPADATLWRYVDFTKFVSMLETNALFFTRADKLDDPFEGSFPRGNVEEDPSSYADPFLAELVRSHRVFVKQIRPFTLVNCWHESSHESTAMWSQYTPKHGGVAIKTDFKSLSKSFVCNDIIFVGRVNYIDYETTSIPRLNDFAPFLHKRKGSEHEKEVRVINIDLPLPPDLFDPDIPLEPLDLSSAIHNVGAYRDVDLATLVNELIVTPHAEDWFFELVRTVAARYALEVSVMRSSLADIPTWI